MAISKVIIPTTANEDYDFLAFSFNGLHSWDDFKIIRVSDGDRYNTNIGPQSQDKTAENPGGDGMYYFNTSHKQKIFNINFAFEEIDDVTIRKMKRWLSSKELGDLWFEEDPYKVYSAKVTGQPTLKYIPFDKWIGGTKTRIYRGEGSVQFTAFWPYAHTPDYVFKDEFALETNIVEPFIETVKTQYLYIQRTDGKTNEVNIQFEYGVSAYVEQNITTNTKIDLGAIYTLTGVKITTEGNLKCKIYITDSEDKPENRKIIYASKIGKDFDSYGDFRNKNEWKIASGLTSSTGSCTGENPGDLPAPFIFTKTGNVGTVNQATVTFGVGELSITVPAEKSTTSGSKTTYTHYKNLTWDSKTGIVSAYKSNDDIGTDKPKPIFYTGESLGSIPVGGLTSDKLTLSGGELNYHYWYY